LSAYVPQCYYCGKDTEVLSTLENSAGDMITLKLNCGCIITVPIIQKLSSLTTSELQKKLRYCKHLVDMRNVCKSTRDSALNFIPKLEAELADRRA